MGIIKEPRFLLPGILRVLRELTEKHTGLEYLESVLTYILNAAPTDNISYTELNSAVHEALSLHELAILKILHRKAITVETMEEFEQMLDTMMT